MIRLGVVLGRPLVLELRERRGVDQPVPDPVLHWGEQWLTISPSLPARVYRQLPNVAANKALTKTTADDWTWFVIKARESNLWK